MTSLNGIYDVRHGIRFVYMQQSVLYASKEMVNFFIVQDDICSHFPQVPAQPFTYLPYGCFHGLDVGYVPVLKNAGGTRYVIYNMMTVHEQNQQYTRACDEIFVLVCDEPMAPIIQGGRFAECKQYLELFT
jgi:hypothetical protein